MSERRTRRDFFVVSAKSLAMATVGGAIWAGYVDDAKGAPLALRPPGAVEGDRFLSLCIKCGLCVVACPFDTLKLSAPGDRNAPLGTPYFTPRQIPCYMCSDIPCVPICPTGALDESLVSSERDGELQLDINKARMGLAVLDEENCIAFWGIQCDACYRACPLIGDAIELEYRRNERSGKHGFLLPRVKSDFCVGCGLCERACVTEKAAIFVMPRALAMGAVGPNYVRGWDAQDEMRIESHSGKTTTRTKKSSQTPTDYLNQPDI